MIPPIRHGGYPCPNCGHTLDALTDAKQTGAVPQEGSAGLCFYCAAILFYKADLTLRKPTPGELMRFSQDSPEGWRILKKVQANLLMQMRNQ